MIRNLGALISLAVVFSGSFAVGTQSVAAKTSHTNASKAKSFFVPPPPPYTPSIGPSALGWMSAHALTEGADGDVVEKSGNFYAKHISTRNPGNMQQFGQTNSLLRFNPALETKIQKHIDEFDSEISNSQKEIGKLLNL